MDIKILEAIESKLADREPRLVIFERIVHYKTMVEHFTVDMLIRKDMKVI